MAEPQPCAVLLQTLLIFCCAENLGISLTLLGLPLLKTTAVCCGVFTAMLSLAIWTKFGEDPLLEKLRRPSAGGPDLQGV